MCHLLDTYVLCIYACVYLYTYTMHTYNNYILFKKLSLKNLIQTPTSSKL